MSSCARLNCVFLSGRMFFWDGGGKLIIIKADLVFFFEMLIGVEYGEGED